MYNYFSTEPNKFIVAMLHVTSLEGEVNMRQIKEELHTMSSGGDVLLKTYENSMKTIHPREGNNGYGNGNVAFSQTTLTLDGDRQHALAVDVRNDELKRDNPTDIEITLSTCAALLTLQHTKYFGTQITTVHLLTKQRKRT
jgi:hypothetical protein